MAYGLADSAMAHAMLSTCEPDQNSSTLECKMQYLSAMTKGVMECEAWVVKRGRSIAFLEAKVTCENKLIATSTATFTVLQPRG